MMQQFYRAVFKGASPAAGLRDAQEAMRRQRRWAHPFYWSGFVLQGQW
jgi:CHAT domain-containing protein